MTKIVVVQIGGEWCWQTGANGLFGLVVGGGDRRGAAAKPKKATKKEKDDKVKKIKKKELADLMSWAGK